MHEYALAQQIIQTAEAHAQKNNATRVTALYLVIGEASGCVADSLALYFDIISENTLCQGAALHIERVKPRLKCQSCGILFERKPFSFTCTQPGCHGEGTPTNIGQEFLLKEITLT